MWDAVEIGWTRPEVAKFAWDKVALVATNVNSKHLMLYFVVSYQMNFIGFLICQLPRTHGKFWRLPTKAPRR